VKHDHGLTSGRIASDLGVNVSPEAVEGLVAFESLLRERALPIGLVAESDRDRLLERHVLDCLRAAAAVVDSDRLAYDMGSGAGLPGIVVAIARPLLRVTLVEPRRSRAAFLELAIERLGIGNAYVHLGRIQDIAEPADLCFARAFAPPTTAWELALPRLRPGGRLVYFGVLPEGDVGPKGAREIRVLATPVLESAGSLTIMAR
jgi:16S rRNA (guanine527-N7)-methyltransferase